MKTGPSRWIASSMAGLMMLSLLVAGCTGPDPVMLDLSQHPEYEFVTLKTYEQERGILFWGCRQAEDGLECDPVCDAGLSGGPICAPELAGEFGRVSGPNSGVMVARYRAEFGRLPGREVAEEVGDADEDMPSGERRRQRPPIEEEETVEEEQAETPDLVEEEEEAIEEEEEVAAVEETEEEVEEAEDDVDEAEEEIAEKEDDDAEEEEEEEEADDGPAQWWEE